MTSQDIGIPTVIHSRANMDNSFLMIRNEARDVYKRWYGWNLYKSNVKERQT